MIEKFERMYAASNNPIHLQTLNGLKARTAVELDLYTKRQFKPVSGSVNEHRTPDEIRAWAELAARVVYPITKVEGGYLITSLIRQETIRLTGEFLGQPWIEYWGRPTLAAAEAKVQQLIHYDWQSRMHKDHGCILADTAKWTSWGEAA